MVFLTISRVKLSWTNIHVFFILFYVSDLKILKLNRGQNKMKALVKSVD